MDSLAAVPALGLTRALFLLILALMLGALVYTGWLTIADIGRIGV